MIGVIVWIIISNFKSTKPIIIQENISPKPAIDQDIADSPVAFGYKFTWLAVRTNDSQKLSELLNLKKIVSCNWKYGIDAAYDKSIFITPAVDGWTIVCGNSLPDGDSKEIREILKILSKEFHEAQFFCTHRVVEYHCWIKAVGGIISRAYSYLGESGENISIEGKPTEFEKKYHFINSFSKEAEDSNYYEREDLVYPDESMVMKIAGNWSVDPTTLAGRIDLPKSLSFLGKR